MVEIKEQDNKGDIEGLRRHPEVHSMNENETSEDDMKSWMRSIRFFFDFE